jgi:hypothetical protein
MKKIIAFCCCFIYYHCNAQNLDSLLNSITEEEPSYISATFKASRIINTQSVEQLKSNHLDFRIHHRFGQINSGAYNFWGLDNGSIFMSLEYGIKDWFTVGMGRASQDKTFNGFGKFKLLRQATGTKACPVSISLYTGADLYTIERKDVPIENINRLSYIFQLLIARKFSESFSLQITPTLIHSNLVVTKQDYNDLFALNAGGRLKLTRRISFNAEYNYAFQPNYAGYTNKPNGLSLGFDIETGGHIFQLMLSNTTGMIERHFINNNLGKWSDGNIVLGFNISRTFSFNQ